MKKNTILLLDDDFTNYIESLNTAAECHNMKIVSEDDIENGLSILRNKQTGIGAVILDLSFTPGNFEGIDALHKIKELNPLIPVIILTGNDSAKDISIAVKCMSKGAFNYLFKSDVLRDNQSLFELLKVAIRQYEVNSEDKRKIILKEVFSEKVTNYNKMLQTTTMILKNILEGQIMFPPAFELRIKSFDSFYDKILRKEKIEGCISDPFERIKDIAGVRVIFYNTTDLKKAIQLLKNSNDFISVLGKNQLEAEDKNLNGYRAKHFDVMINPEKRIHLKEYQGIEDIPCEIQFTTIFAHSWSKVHHAFSYKKSGKIIHDPETQKKLKKDSITASIKLEEIENQINTLCINYNDSLKNN